MRWAIITSYRLHYETMKRVEHVNLLAAVIVLMFSEISSISWKEIVKESIGDSIKGAIIE